MFPRWLTWLFVLFLGYMVVSTHRSATAPDAPGEPASTHREAETPRENRAIRALLDGDRWLRAIEPDRPAVTDAAPSRCSAPEPAEGQPRSHALVEQAGDGPAAACGERVQLAVTVWPASGEGAVQELGDVALLLGEQPRLDALLVGLRPGEVRQLLLHMPKHPYAALPELGQQGWRLLRVARTDQPQTAKEKAGH